MIIAVMARPEMAPTTEAASAERTQASCWRGGPSGDWGGCGREGSADIMSKNAQLRSGVKKRSANQGDTRASRQRRRLIDRPIQRNGRAQTTSAARSQVGAVPIACWRPRKSGFA